jgi:alkylation response protein AidB-like acyl-CoA dehydrogenase
MPRPFARSDRQPDPELVRGHKTFMQRRIDAYLEQLLDEERFAFYQSVASFAEAEAAPKLLEWERKNELLPDSFIARMAELGLFGLPIEAEYGGQGGGQLELVLMGLALGYHSHSVAITPGAAASLGSKPIQLFGTEAQKKAMLPELAAGKRMVVFGLTEPGRGSDAANPEVTATKTKGGWIIKGEKCWMTNAKWASHAIVHALTSPGAKGGHRSTCFLLPMSTKGISYNEMGGKMVWRQSSTGSIAFDDVFVADDGILGGLDDGFKVMVAALNGGRLFIAGLALASTAFALDRCRTYATERIQFDGAPIGRFQRVQDVILDLDIALEEGLTWLVRLLALYDAQKLDREQAAKVKIACSRRASHLLIEAMEICGGVACLDEFGLMRHHADLFVTRVGEGSNRALKTQATRPLMPGLSGMQ